jgi:Ca2+-binding EF-hand superfamily protein
LRKLFEEARSNHIHELNGDDLFKDNHRNFDGSIKKDDFIYSLVNKDFTLTRTELSNICTLLLNISRNDNDNIDIDELQNSFRSYLKYYELLESRIMDLLEKFKLSINKRIEEPADIERLINEIYDRSGESKINVDEFKELLENHGISIRDALYDQLLSYFDLDRTNQLYIPSFCEYLRNPSMRNFNFFKVNPTILTTQIGDYVKNSVESRKDSM